MEDQSELYRLMLLEHIVPEVKLDLTKKFWILTLRRLAKAGKNFQCAPLLQELDCIDVCLAVKDR